MGNIVFSVLHYESLDDTKACIDSLIKYLKQPDVHVIVVDNGSKNGKLQSIVERYSAYKNIHFVFSEKNLGFAKGNNIGFKYAKEKLNAEIIILANNDLIFFQEDFVERLARLHNETDFDIAGPCILSMVDGKNQNPVRVSFGSIKDVNNRINKHRILYCLSVFDLDRIVRKFFAKEVVEFKPTQEEEFQIHGACMLFSNRYVREYDGLYDGTFMYGEEDILRYIVQNDGLKMIYSDDIVVYHKEGSSTDVIYGKGKKKRQFFYKWSIDSCKKLKRMMK